MLPATRALGSLTLFSCVNGEFLGCSNDIVVLEEIIQTGKEKEKRQEDNADVLVILLLLVGLKFFVIPGDTGGAEGKVLRLVAVVVWSMYLFVSFEL